MFSKPYQIIITFILALILLKIVQLSLIRFSDYLMLGIIGMPLIVVTYYGWKYWKTSKEIPIQIYAKPISMEKFN